MRTVLSICLCFLFLAPALGQDVRVIKDDDSCYQMKRNNGDYEQFCEVREITLPANRKTIDIDGGQNGGIRVNGWDKNEILVRAVVTGHARSEDVAQQLVDKVKIETGRVIQADVPKIKNTNWRTNNTWVSVSFEVFVPHESNLALETHNGGVKIADVAGDVDFDVLNGGVSLVNLAGNIEGSTTNGGIDLVLTGDEWEGEGVDVKTTNGGVEIKVPDDYSARLETSTVNGRVKIDFPVTVKGRVDRNISTVLGDGGETIRATTVNGGVRVKRS